MVDYNADTEMMLIKKAITGDIQAFNQLYDQHFLAIYTHVKYSIPTPDVEDVTQEVFIAMVKSLRRFKGNSTLKTWLLTITRRKIADYYRKRDRRLKFEKDNTILDLRRRDKGNTFRKKHDNQILLKRALNRLPDHYREVILLRFVDEYQFNEIAEIIGKSLEATKSQYRRAISALRKEVEKSYAIQ